MGFRVILGEGRRYLVGKYMRPQNCAFSDIFGPDLTPRVVAIAICHRRKFEQVWGSTAPLPEVTSGKGAVDPPTCPNVSRTAITWKNRNHSVT